jgi:amidase
MADLWRHDASTLAALISSGEASSVEVVQAHLDRIDEVNGKLNAVTSVLAESALAAAAEADRAGVGSQPRGPLHGVPFTVKQNIDLAGSATNWGLPALAEVIASEDSPVVERMRAAGAIPIARTNCPDMALRVHTDSSNAGLTRTPWTADHTAGGSSGGEASCLASGMSPIGLGNDIGGSLRNPASCNGIASLKPSAGRVPLFTHAPAPDGPASFQLMPVEGPMARRVADVRLGLSVLEGRHPKDPFSVPSPPVTPLDRPARVAVMADPPGGSTDPRVAERIEAAAAALEAAGYALVDSEPPRFTEAVETWTGLLVNDLRMLAPTVAPLMGEDANRFLDYAMAPVPEVDLGGYTEILMQRQSIMRDWAQWMTGVDLLLSPVWTQLPFVHGWDAESSENALATLEMIRCVTIANVLGLPAAAVTTGLVDGRPVGAMVAADRFADHVALDAAQVIEDALGLDTPIDPTY